MNARATATAALLAVLALAPPTGAQLLLHDAKIEQVAGLSPRAALERFGDGEAVWIGWSVDALPDDSVCCHRLHREGTCSLASESRGWSSYDSDDREPQTELVILAETRRGEVVDLRLVSPDCRIDGAGRRVVWIGAIGAGPSLDLLESLLDVPDSDADVADRALAAIAYHPVPRADALLERRAFDSGLDEDDREQALFWSGNLRGDRGYRLLDRFLDSEADADLRSHAVFALSQSSSAGAIERVKRVSAEDRDAEVRSQALFWLAQSDTGGAATWILDRMNLERDAGVREQAVFALSQLEDGADWLLRLMKSSREPEVVRQALFWLSQSDDPRALAELERILAD
jgi:hypothetical protein